MSSAPVLRACAVVPTYDNPRTLRPVVEAIRGHLEDVIVVDDGSDEPGRQAAAALERDGLAEVLRRPRNGGKGAAVIDGLRRARDRGFSHAVQVDADGQHEVSDIPRFLEAVRERPDALVAGRPVFDETAPRSRRLGRVLSQLWAAVETGGPVIHDPLCGFRVYPVERTLAAGSRSQRMDFDNEVAVRLYWSGVEVVNLPTRVRYLSEEEGGVSHYDLLWDNVRMSLMHARLSLQAGPRLVLRRLRSRR